MLGRRAVLLVVALPLGAQTYDLRFEVPFPQGQSLPQTLVAGTGQAISGSLDRGNGGILTLERRFLEFPVIRLSGGLELAQLRSSGTVSQGSTQTSSTLTQSGFGVGLHTQFWVPFTGLAGEIGLVQRVQHYRYEAGGAAETHDLSRTWLRVGARWRLPFPGLNPYLAASYQEPGSKDHPVKVSSVSNLATYLGAQGSGQGYQRLWTFGVGCTF